MGTHTWDAWNYRESAEVSARGKDLTGFSVEAIDGHIGKIDRTTLDVGSSYVVVDHRSRRLERREGLRRPDEGPDQGLP
jgi:hypothetical protein